MSIQHYSSGLIIPDDYFRQQILNEKSDPKDIEEDTLGEPTTIRLINMELFIKSNDLKQITNPISLETQGRATSNGLFSTDIFGRPGSEQRKKTWAYIDLVNVYLHPLIYKTFCQLDRKFPSFIAGDRPLGITSSGQLIPYIKNCIPVNDLNDLHKHWDKIKWIKSNKFSATKNNKLELLSITPKEDIFVTKWPVMPAGFRDVDLSANSKEIPPINNEYVKLITVAPPSSSGIDFYNGARRLKAQDALLNVMELALGLVAKKRGIIQEQLLGRYVDYSTRGVISGPNLGKYERPEEIQIPYQYIGVPLYLLLNLFYPLIVREAMAILNFYTNFEGGVSILDPKTKKYERVKLPKEVVMSLSTSIIDKWITRFLRSQSDRLEPFAIESKITHQTYYLTILNEYLGGRQATMTDFFMFVAYRAIIVPNLKVYYTRYPITEFNSANFAFVKILTTEKTIIQKFPQSEAFPEEIIIRDYPDLSNIDKTTWLDSFIIHGANTKAMEADFDGDTIRVIGIFSQEANATAEKIMNSPSQFIGTKGQSSRPLTNEGVLTLYCLTA